MQNDQDRRNVSLVLTILFALFILLINPKLPVLIVSLFIIFLAVVTYFSRGNSASTSSLNAATPPSEIEREDHYPDLDESFTYRGRHLPQSRRPSPSSSEPTPFPQWVTHVGGHSVFPHALNAMKNADKPIDTSQPMPVDLGLLVYRGDAKPNIHRTLNIPHAADYLQPYLQLHVPVPAAFSGMIGRVRFEITDSVGQVMFNHEQEYTFKDGLNLITPPARFSAHKALYGYHPWGVRISLGDILLAKYAFEWGDMKTPEIAEGLEEDGEIGDALRRLVAEQGLEPLSLDELLVNQPNDDQEAL